MATRSLMLLFLTLEVSASQMALEMEAVEQYKVLKEAVVRAALSAKTALHAARLYFLFDQKGGLAHEWLLARVQKALAQGENPTAAAVVDGKKAAAESGAALVVLAAPSNSQAAHDALKQVPGWPNETSWLLLLHQGTEGPSPTEVVMLDESDPGNNTGLVKEAVNALADVDFLPPGGRVLVTDTLADTATKSVEAGAVWRWGRGRPLSWKTLRPLTAMAVSDAWRGTTLDGATLRVTTLHYSPMMIFDDSLDPPLVDGFFGQLWQEFQRRLHFQSEWMKPMDGNWGSLVNGEWNGMVSLLRNGSADVAVNSFSITESRLNAIDFSSTVINTRVCAFVGMWTSRAVEWGDYTRPFSLSLWAACGAALAVMALALTGLYALARRLGDPRAPPEPQCESPLASIFYVFGIFCQQGHDITPESLSCRVVYLTAYVTAVTLLAAYSAGLIAFLAVVRVFLPFTNFQEMLDLRPSYRLGMAKSSGLLNAFDQAKDPLLRTVYRRLIAPGLRDLPSDHAEVRRRLCSASRPYAYMRSQILGLRSGGGDCEVVPVPGASLPEALALMLPKRSPLRRLINWHLQEMKQQGILSRIMLTFWPRIEPLDENPYIIVGLENIIPVIVILAVGIIASIVLLLGEILSQRIIDTRKLPYVEHPEEALDNNSINQVPFNSSAMINESISSTSSRTSSHSLNTNREYHHEQFRDH